MSSPKYAALAALCLSVLPTISLAQSAIVKTDASIASAPGAELVGLWGFDDCSEDENYEF